MNAIIGGMFALQMKPIEDEPGLSILKQPSIRLVNASSSLWLLSNQLKPPRIWLPSYLCPSMIRAVDNKTSEIRFYPIDHRLALESTLWLEGIRANDLVVFIDYFGFPFNSNLARRARKKGAKVVRDASQALLGQPSADADFSVYSPRKFFGIPDGGILVGNTHPFKNRIHLKSPPQEWWLKALQASTLRLRFDLEGGENRWFSIFREVEANAPIGPYRMSDLSELLLEFCVDTTAAVKRRRDNFLFLADRLSHIAIFPKLPDMVVPLGFPVSVDNRDRVRSHLIERKIFPPVHWELDGSVPEKFTASHALSKSILTLPCDQRYNEPHMKRIVENLQGARRA